MHGVTSTPAAEALPRGGCRPPSSSSSGRFSSHGVSLLVLFLLPASLLIIFIAILLPSSPHHHVSARLSISPQSEKWPPPPPGAHLLPASSLSRTWWLGGRRSASSAHHLRHRSRKDAAAGLITTACGAALLPSLCSSTLQSDPAAQRAASLQSVVDAAIGVARSQLLSCVSLSDALLRWATHHSSVNLTHAAADCSYLLRRSVALHNKSAGAGAALQSWQVADAQAWMSAALTYENDCRSAFSYANISDSVGHAMDQVSLAINFTSIALSMIDAIRAGDVWAPPTRLSLYEAVPSPPFPPPPAADWWLQAAVTVAQDGSGDYTTVQAAVDAAPAGIGGGAEWYTIRIKAGVYKETVRVPWNKTKLAMVGEGMGKTVITGHLNAQMPGLTTYDTATVAVDGDGFVAVGMTFENTAGAAKHQAVALRVDGDMAAFYNCSFLGYQDTLYAHALRHFYRSCRIEGTIDFIFGNAAAVFQDCDVVFREGMPGVGTSVVTAQGRTDPGETTAMVIHRSRLRSLQPSSSGRQQHRFYLGRPWKLFSRTVFLSCDLPEFLHPDGWMPWTGNFALSTLFYGEFNNSGEGARPSGRVSWSSQISQDIAALFTPAPFIQADRWLPATNVPFDLAL